MSEVNSQETEIESPEIPRGQIETAEKIISAHRDLFPETCEITQIDAGFNNHLFSVNDRFVIKSCGKPAKEPLFKTESRFYEEFRGCDFIPELYCFDDTKTVVPDSYEILEKVHGKTVYYAWYLWSEEERESFIKRLVPVLEKIHEKEYPGSGWAEKTGALIRGYYEKTGNMFSAEDRELLEKSFERYPEILQDTRYVRIHNDLHFDNILLEEGTGRIRLIDFNDTVIAPPDFEYRQLYMCLEFPWRWADEAMDPLQIPEDYAHIWEYLRKYSKELADIPNLEARMEVYAILNEFNLLSRFREQESADNIIRFTKRIL